MDGKFGQVLIIIINNLYSYSYSIHLQPQFSYFSSRGIIYNTELIYRSNSLFNPSVLIIDSFRFIPFRFISFHLAFNNLNNNTFDSFLGYFSVPANPPNW